MKANRKSRSVTATKKGLERLKKAKATQRNDGGKPWTYAEIAKKAELDEKTVKNFFYNKGVARYSALAIARALDLEITEIVDPEDWEPAEATEAEATPAADPENSTTPTTPNTPIMGRLSVVPKIPENLLPRDEEIAAVKKLLLGDTKQPVAIAGQSRQVGIQGMGGIGKSTLAAIVAHDEEVRRRFPDGIFWQPLGQNPSLRLRQLDLCKTLGDPEPQFEDVQGGKVHLRELLKNKTCLLILDDVWQVDDADAFNVLSSSSQLLLTTRNLEPIHGLNAQEFQLSILSDTQAQAMLASYAGQHPENLPTITHEIARECGNLPLALAMIGAQMRGKPENRWDNLLNKLRKADLEKIRFDFADYPYPDLFKAIQVSVEELEAEEQKRYLDFAVFPEDTPIPEAVLQTFWQPEGLDQYDTQDIIDRLVNLSLAQRDNQERITLHDLQYDYVRKQAGDLSVLHNRLLNAYAAKCENGWHTGPNDGYFFEHLANHLLADGKKSELRQLLFNFQWLEAKLNATDVNALIADYELLSEDPDLCLIQEAIQLSAYDLTHDKNQLASQILGRLLSFDSPQIKEFLKQVKPSLNIPWLRPLTPSLMPPGGALLKTLLGHKFTVSAIAITSDSKQIISASGDQTIKIWDLATGTQLKSLTGHTGWIFAVVITPDGKHIISASADKTIKVWDLETGKIIQTLTGHKDRVYGVRITSDGKKVVSRSEDKTLKVWDLSTGQAVLTIQESPTSKFIISPDDKHIIAPCGQETKILELATGKLMQTLKGCDPYNSSLCELAMTPNGNYLIYAPWDDTLKVCDLNTGEELQTLIGHKSGINLVATITPDGKQLFSGGKIDKMIKIWDLETGEELRTLTINNRDISAIAITPDKKFLVTGSNDNSIKIWDLHSTEEPPKFPGHDDAVSAVAISPDGRLAFSGSQDGIIKIWDLPEIEESKEIQTNYPIFDFVIHPDQLLAFFNTEENAWEETLKFYDITNDREGQQFIDDWFGNLRAVSVTGRLAISDAWDENRADDTRLIKVWDLKEERKLWQLLVGRSFQVAAISANEKFAITGSCDGTVIIWDLCNQQELWNFAEIHGELEVVAISATGKIAASASNIWGNSLIIRDLITGKTLHNDDYIEVPMGISTLVISADEKLLISSGHSRLTVWNLDTLEVITTFDTEGDLPACAVAPDNRTIIVGEESGRLHFLRLEGL